MSVCDLVEAQAKATPNKTALASGKVQISYGELDIRANRLAHLLRAAGVGTEVPVGIYMPRSISLAVGALAILKAGGAYVPLDSSYPAARIRAILEDSQVPVLLTQPDLAGQLPDGRWRTVVVDEKCTVAADCPTVAPSTDRKPENLAYVIFTSGSTGRPKGVQITHANLMNLIAWHCGAFSITPADRATMHASPGFDASVWELWPHLAAGASVHLIDEAVRAAPELLRDWIISNRITVSFLPTALVEVVIELPWPRETSLRFLLTGADTLRHHPPASLPFVLVNNYGPTECTVVATSGVVRSEGTSQELPTIGSPIANTRVYVVDENQKQVPAGTPGELLIGGAGVSRGYLNRPDLTAEKFIADPFSHEPGARLYKTGDLGRLLADGQFAFMGRLDDQIKIRGHRIEPQEITTVLDRHPGIRASCVVSGVEESGEVGLIGYVVPADNEQLTLGEVRDFLGKFLPESMIPSTFVRLEELPISLNGKVDRSALPKPSSSNTLEMALYEAPQSPTEQRAAALMEALLGKRVGRENNFFALGGHSLMGAQIISKIHERFGVELPLLSLFDRPTVRELSAEIERLIYARLESMSEEEAQRILSSVPVPVQ